MAVNLYSKEDICILDNLKGVAISLIFIFHSQVLGALTTPFLPFMIPFFAFASGFAFKSGDLLPYTKKIFALYLLANLIYLPLAMLKPKYPAVDLPLLLLGPNTGVLWYFIALIVWAAVSKWINQFRYPLLVALLLSVLIYRAAGYISVNNTGSYYGLGFFSNVDWTIRFFIFFWAGTWIPWERVVSLRRLPWRFAGFPLVILFLVCVTKKDYYCENNLVSYWKNLFYLAGCALFVGTAIALFPGRHLPVLTDIGKASLSVYLLHMVPIIAVIPYVNIGMQSWVLPLIPDVHHLRQVVLRGSGLLVVLLFLFLLSRRQLVIWLNNQASNIQHIIFRSS